MKHARSASQVHADRVRRASWNQRRSDLMKLNQRCSEIVWLTHTVATSLGDAQGHGGRQRRPDLKHERSGAEH